MLAHTAQAPAARPLYNTAGTASARAVSLRRRQQLRSAQLSTAQHSATVAAHLDLGVARRVLELVAKVARAVEEGAARVARPLRRALVARRADACGRTRER